MAFQKTHFSVFAVLVCIALIPFFAVALYAFPTADDFCNMLTSAKVGFAERVSGIYSTWSGRYTPTMIGWFIHPYITNIGVYISLILVRMLALLFVSYVLMQKCFGFSRMLSGLSAAVLCVVFFAGMPDLGQGIYWHSAARVYTLGIIFGVVYSCMLYSVLVHAYSWKSYYLYATACVLVLAVGCNETVSLIILGLHTIIYVFYRHVCTKQFMVLTLLLCIAAIVSFAAPGNFARSSLLVKPDFIYLCKETVLQTLVFFMQWMSLPITLWLALFFVLLGMLRGNKHTIALLHALPVLALPGILFWVVLSGVAPSVFGLGGIGSLRMINPSYYFFLCVICVYSYHLGSSVVRKYLGTNSFAYIHIVVLVLFIPAYVFAPNSRTLFDDVRKQRFAVFSGYTHSLQQLRGEQPSTLPEQIPQAFSYFVVPQSNKNWALDCMKKVYAAKYPIVE